MNRPVNAHDADVAQGSIKGPVMLHVWRLEPQSADRHIRLLTELFAGIADQPGFVSARVLESPGRSSIAAIIELRTVEDRQRLERHPKVHEVLYQLRGAANFVAQLYHEVAEFDPRRSAAAA